MDSDQMNHREPRDDELRRRLEAYAEARLSPETSATTRMRAQVMAAAQRAVEPGPAGADRASAITGAALADRRRRSAWRRPMTVLLAAGLTLAVGVSSVAGAQPGGPLYGARIWAETLALPSDESGRAQAELRRLDARLAEVAAATAVGDTNAANAALEAYGAIVTEATVGAGGSVAAAARLDAGVRSNMDVLRILAGQVPEKARDAIRNAIERSDSALDELHGKPAGNSPAATPTPERGATDRPERTANPNKPTPDPADLTQKPHPTPKPDPAPKPKHTPRSGG